MPKAIPKEFRADVIRVYRDPDSSIARVAKDFGVSPSCLKRWLDIDERDATDRSSRGSAGESDELREARQRIPLIEQENEVLRRAAAHCRSPSCRAAPEISTDSGLPRRRSSSKAGASVQSSSCSNWQRSAMNRSTSRRVRRR